MPELWGRTLVLFPICNSTALSIPESHDLGAYAMPDKINGHHACGSHLALAVVALSLLTTVCLRHLF